MKIGIYAPALTVYGGGEKYIGKIAEILSRENDVAFIALAKPDFKKLEGRLNIDLGRVAIDNIGSPALPVHSRIAILFNFVNAYRISRHTRKYELFVNQEHVTFIPSHSQRSILICEVPPVRSLLNRNPFIDLFFDPKIETYDRVVVNSRFTKSWAEEYYRKEATVLYPPVDTESFIPSSKGNIILSVGRFSTALHCKKQLEMVQAFKKLYTAQKLMDWEYHLVGGLGRSPRDHKYLEDCKKEAKDYPILFHANAPFEVMKALYGTAKVFWHATGIGEDEIEHPERMEHFGITTVEAMSAGCVPIAINKGGQPEIVQDKISGFLFETVEELNSHTLKLIKNDALWRKMSEACMKRSQEFSLEKFERRVLDVFHS